MVYIQIVDNIYVAISPMSNLINVKLSNKFKINKYDIYY